MSLEYSDDNELIYQAKAVAKDIVNAKYEVTKKVGNFLFLAHSDEEFYQRATTIDNILESTSTRRLASVSDSKAKLVKALYQEWELKHASCKQCTASYPTCSKDGCNNAREDNGTGKCKSCNDNDYNTPNEVKRTSNVQSSPEINFSLPERVASPVVPKSSRSGKNLWDKWTFLSPNKTTGKVEKRDLSEATSKGKSLNSEQLKTFKASILDKAIGGSLGRVDDPEISKLVTPDSHFWVVPEGIYGRDKKRTDNSLKPGRNEDGSPIIDPTKFHAMIGKPLGISALGNKGVFHTYHKCTGNTFQGFDMSDNSFKKCEHEHHDGDGCGLTSDTPGVSEGSMQPGCGQQHIITKVTTPIFSPKNGNIHALPFLADEEPKDISGEPAQNQKATRDRIQNSGTNADDFTHPSMEQVGAIPPSRLFLMHPEQSALIPKEEDRYHVETGGEGSHPSHLGEFKIGDKTHRVGDIVSTTRSWGNSDPRTENNVGVVVGVSSHRNGEHFRLGRSTGITPNPGGDLSMKDGPAGEYSLIIHKLNSPKTGKTRYTPTGVEPDSGKIVSDVNEETQYHPSSSVDTIQKYQNGKGNTPSKLYSTMKKIQSTFKARPETERAERPKTVNPGRGSLDLSTLDLSSLFGDVE